MNLKKTLALFTLQNNTGKVARNTAYLMLSEIFLKFIGVLWIIYLAHSFTVDSYGIYNYITSTIAIFSFLPDFGVGLIVIREIAKDPRRAPSYLGNSLFLNGALAVITYLAIIFFSIFLKLSSQTFYLLMIAGLTLTLSTIRSVSIFYFDGKEKMHYSAILNSLNSLLLIIFGAAAIYLGLGLSGVFWGMFFATVLSLFISWKFLFKFVKPSFSFRSKTIKYYLMQGSPLGIASFASLIYSHIDVLILSQLLGDKSVGIYSAATPFVFALIQVLNVPFVVAVYPALSRLQKGNKKRFINGFLKSLLFIALWSFPSAIIISILSPFVIPLFFGAKYDSAVPILRVLIFAVPFMSMTALLYKGLIVLKKQKDYLVISIFGAIINIFLNFSLIPNYGIFGAVWATIVTQAALVLIYSFTLFFRVRNI